MKWREVGIVVFLGAIWGVSFLLVQVAAPVLGPLVLVNVRMLIGGGILWLYIRATRQPPLDWGHSWKAFFTLAVLNSTLPLTLEAIAVVELNASMVAILATTAPLFTALVAGAWLREPLTRGKIAGLVFGLVGVGLLVGWSPLPLTQVVLLAAGAVLAASILYAIASVYARATIGNIAPITLTTGQELAAGLLLLPFTLTVVPSIRITLPVVGATLALALIMTAMGNLLYYRLLANVGPTKAQSVSFLTPVFALLAGVVLFDEPVTASMILGLGVIFISVLLVLEIELRTTAVVQAAIKWSTPFGAAFRAWIVRGPQRATAATPNINLSQMQHQSINPAALYDRHSTPAIA